MNKKKIGIIILILVVTIGMICFFYQNHYKKANLGNTNLKSQKEFEEYILNLQSYEAKVEVTINSNKNTNQYVLQQKYCEPDMFLQEVIEPENIAGLKTSLVGETLTIENSRMALTEMYENYPYINENFLSLYDFIQDYKEDEKKQCQKTEKEIILKAKTRQENPYIKYKTLYVDAKTGLPQKMEVQDNNQNTLVYILYKEIKINSTNKESIIAFQLSEYHNTHL